MNEPLINSRRLTKHGYVSEFCLYIIFCVSNYQWSQTLEGGCNKKHRVVQCDIIKCCIVNYMATVSVSMVVYCAGSFLGSNSCCPVSMCLLKRRKKKKSPGNFHSTTTRHYSLVTANSKGLIYYLVMSISR